MKKLSSLFLSLLILFSVTGCGSDTEKLAGAVLDAAIDAVENYESDSHDDSYSESEPNVSFSPSDPEEIGVIGGDTFTVPIITDSSVSKIVPVLGEYYYDLENVVLYLEYYGELPDNYITKDEARAIGWNGGTPERYLEGSAIGGDRFGNREGLLPKGQYTECDLNTLGETERGAERLVFSDDGEYYYTEDHYETFTEIWVENGEVVYK